MHKILSNFEKVQEFNNAMGVEHSLEPNNIELRLKLIEEEIDETVEELYPVEAGTIDKQKLAKELADLLYVVYGAADAFDIDIDEAFRRVHASNMSKLDEAGKPIRRADGKVMKGPNYKAPDMSFVT